MYDTTYRCYRNVTIIRTRAHELRQLSEIAAADQRVHVFVLSNKRASDNLDNILPHWVEAFFCLYPLHPSILLESHTSGCLCMSVSHCTSAVAYSCALFLAFRHRWSSEDASTLHSKRTGEQSTSCWIGGTGTAPANQTQGKRDGRRRQQARMKSNCVSCTTCT